MNKPPMNLHARLADLYCELASTHRRLAAEAGEHYVDQHNSPLGARLHCRLVRSGELPGYRVGRRILARRADVDAYLERCKIAPSEPADGAISDEEAALRALVARHGGRAA